MCSRAVLACVLLLVDLSRPAVSTAPTGAGPRDDLDLHTEVVTASWPDGALGWRPGQSEQAGDVESNAGFPVCRRCRDSHFRQSGSSGGIRSQQNLARSGYVAARSRATDQRSRATPRRRTRCGRCLPCSVCPSGQVKLTNCTATQDTVCSPCPEGQAWDPVRRRCKKVHPLVHEVIVENISPTSAFPVATGPPDDQTTQTNPRYPDTRFPGDGDTNKLDRQSPSLTEEAKNEEGSAGYLASLFASGAAGVTVLILIVVIFIYLSLRCKQWKNEHSLSPAEGCLEVRSCFENICKQGSHTVSADDADYSTSNNQNTAETPGALPTASADNTTTDVDFRFLESRVSRRTTHFDGLEIRMETAVGCPEDTGESSRASTSGKVGQPDGGFVKKISPEFRRKQSWTGNLSDLTPCSIPAECLPLFDGYEGRGPKETKASGKDYDPENPSSGYAGNCDPSSAQENTVPRCLPPSPLPLWSSPTNIITTDAVVHDIFLSRPPTDEGSERIFKNTNV